MLPLDGAATYSCAVQLPVMPPVAPMLAQLMRELPTEGSYLYEPKWDGFRCVVFRDHDEVELGSRNERPLTRYFPELVASLRDALPERCVLDGEIVIATPKGLDFDALLQRIHPAKSRIERLARETPSSFVAFDVLALGDRDLREEPLSKRRELLEEATARSRSPVHRTPATRDAKVAEDWFHRFEGAGLDGVMVKPIDLKYVEGKRVMFKVKHQRTADCVVAGYRVHKDGRGVGSLLLGLFDDAGQLHHVGVAIGFSAKKRAELIEYLAPFRRDALSNHPWKGWAEATAQAAEATRMPGAPSRWTGTRDLSWEAIRPELVAEVAYDHLQGDRFRHATKWLRWRADREPPSCTYAQLTAVAPEELSRVFGA